MENHSGRYPSTGTLLGRYLDHLEEKAQQEDSLKDRVERLEQEVGQLKRQVDQSEGSGDDREPRSIMEEAEDRKVIYGKFVEYEKELVKVLRAHGIEAEHIDESKGPAVADILIKTVAYGDLKMEVKTRTKGYFKKVFKSYCPWRVMPQEDLVDPPPHLIACISQDAFDEQTQPLEKYGFWFAWQKKLIETTGFHQDDSRSWLAHCYEDAFNIAELKQFVNETALLP